MSNRQNFDALVNHAMQVSGRAHMRPVVEKELLHYDILFSLDRAGLLDEVVFQGGTALRLCHRAPRFSEDLDFVGGEDFQASNLLAMKECVETYLGQRYGLEVQVKEPKHMREKPEPVNDGINVDKWQISIQTAPERPDIPRQRIKLEVANVPAYTSEPRPLHNNYDFLPDGYAETLVATESLDEILADKLVSLPACNYLRYRDIWDLTWLAHPKRGAQVDAVMVAHKISDYKVEGYMEKAREMAERMPEIVRSREFIESMNRFLPDDIQQTTLDKDKFLDFMTQEVKQLLKTTLTRLNRPDPGPEFDF